MNRWAHLSDDGEYRYALLRRWRSGRNYVNFVGLNPSTADGHVDDPTVRRLVSFASSWGFPAFMLTNLFAYRATSPGDMMKKGHDAVGPDNDRWLREVAGSADKVVVCWGTHGGHLSRAQDVLRDLRVIQCLNVWTFGLTQGGTPKHPLYLKGDTELELMP